MKLLLIQGANMEYLGRRQPEPHGTTAAKELDAILRRQARMIAGLGVDSYVLALEAMVSRLHQRDKKQ
jgi:3-dehydroquinate dehydratase II